MTEESDLLAAIRANPAEDTPRLMYADWLQEHGQGERAEFIRVQCELARIDRNHDPLSEDGYDDGDGLDCAVCDRLAELTVREQELLNENDLHWYAESGLGDFVAGVVAQIVVNDNKPQLPVWHRGFVSEITCSAEDWLTHGDAIVAAQPVEKVMLSTLPRLLGDEDEGWLQLDSTGKRFEWMAVIAERRESDPEYVTDAGMLVPLLRLRYGRGIEFTVPQFEYPWQGDLPPVTQPVDSVPQFEPQGELQSTAGAPD